MDWNWFFSSVAQSVAALDGTLLAFVIAILLNNQATYNSRLVRLADIEHEAERIRDALSIRAIPWYNRQILRDSLDSLAGSLKPSTAPGVAENIARQVHRSDYQEFGESVAAIQKWLAELVDADRARAQKRSNDPFGSSMPSLSMMSGTAMQTQTLRHDALRREVEEEGEKIRQLELQAKSTIRSLGAVLSEIDTDPERSPVIRVTLCVSLVLFAGGVIYPLSFLPLSTQRQPTLSVAAFLPLLFSLRGAILAIASLGFGGLVIMLAVVNERLCYSSDFRASLREWLIPRSYSAFLGNAEINRKANSARRDS